LTEASASLVPRTASTVPAALPREQNIPRPVEPVLRGPTKVELTAATVPRTEVEATRQMVAAHAALRDPRVADPDSAENRTILQTMVLKALTNRSSASAR
jgi:hypothetical protein